MRLSIIEAYTHQNRSFTRVWNFGELNSRLQKAASAFVLERNEQHTRCKGPCSVQQHDTQSQSMPGNREDTGPSSHSNSSTTSNYKHIPDATSRIIRHTVQYDRKLHVRRHILKKARIITCEQLQIIVDTSSSATPALSMRVGPVLVLHVMRRSGAGSLHLLHVFVPRQCWCVCVRRCSLGVRLSDARFD